MATYDTTGMDAVAAYIQDSMKAPMLEKEHEFALARRWRDEKDEAALHELVGAYGRLAVSIAQSFRFYGLPVADLIQEANVGLMQAADRFDPDRDVRFSTYATWWIRASIQDYVLRNWSIVRLGSTTAQKSLFFNLRRLRGQILTATKTEHLDTAGREKIAEQLKVSLDDVEKMENRLNCGDKALDAPVADDTQMQWVDRLVDEGANPEISAMSNHDRARKAEWISSAIASLSEREQLIIRRRRLSEDSITLEKLGQELGVSKERIRQLEKRAMGKMQEHLLEITDGERDDLLT